jgi:hypothetical protein
MRGRAVCLALAVLLVMGGCSEDEPAAGPPSATTPTVRAPEVDVPEGVELTEAGTELALGEPAAAVFQAAPGRVSTIEVTVTRVVKGSMRRDFANFGLSAQQLRQEPYYVTATVTNTGPNPLGGTSGPVFALDSGDTYFPPTTLAGQLPACQGRPLPKPFVPADSVVTCLVFLAQPGTTVEEVQLRPYEGFEPVSWAVPESVELAAQRRERREQPGGGRADKPRKPSDRG